MALWMRRMQSQMRSGERGRSLRLTTVIQIELEVVRDQPLRVDLVRRDGLEQHRDGDGVDQACGDRDIAIPKAFQMEIDLLSMHADIGDLAAGCDDFFAQFKGCGMPTASMAVSTPRFAVIFMTASAAL